MKNRSETIPHIIFIFQRIFFLIFSFFSSFFLIACSATDEEPKGCTPPLQEITEEDLVGTWVDEMNPRLESTIVIRDDGLYKQIIHVERTGLLHESEWRPWEIEYFENGLLYLHLKGFLLCAYWFDIECGEIPSDDDNLEDGRTWYDYCKEEWVNTPGEVVFIILGTPKQFKQPPRGIKLFPFTKSTVGISGPVYVLQEP